MIGKAFREYANFLTRSTRWEFFSFWIFQFIVQSVIFGIISSVLVYYWQKGLIYSGMSDDQFSRFMVSSPFFILIMICLLIIGITNIPQPALAVRRLHDAGYSAWWMFLLIVPVLGWIAFTVFACLPPKNENNQWGQDPRIVPRPVDQIGICGYCYKKAWRNYFNFRGVADISELFGFGFVFTITLAMIYAVCLVLGFVLQFFIGTTDAWSIVTQFSLLVYFLYIISAIIPSLSLSVRRLRDAGFSPWLVLLTLIGSLGAYAVWILCCQPKKSEEERYTYDWSDAPQ